MKRRIGLMGALALLAIIATQTVGAASTTWKLYSFNASGRALSSQVSKFDGTSVSAKLPTDSYTGAAYLTSSKTQSSGALSATVSATGTGPIENYPGCTNSTTNPTVGLYFEGKATGKFNPSNYWWSSERVSMNSLFATPANLSTMLSNSGAWTNYYGKPGNQPGTYVVEGTTYPPANEGFANAVANMTSWGVSFGGDCFYANGVAAPNATITVNP
jgi:hypothetical protein